MSDAEWANDLDYANYTEIALEFNRREPVLHPSQNGPQGCRGAGGIIAAPLQPIGRLPVKIHIEMDS